MSGREQKIRCLFNGGPFDGIEREVEVGLTDITLSTREIDPPNWPERYWARYQRDQEGLHSPEGLALFHFIGMWRQLI